jgi:hypothetical protein
VTTIGFLPQSLPFLINQTTSTVLFINEKNSNHKTKTKAQTLKTRRENNPNIPLKTSQNY